MARYRTTSTAIAEHRYRTGPSGHVCSPTVYRVLDKPQPAVLVSKKRYVARGVPGDKLNGDADTEKITALPERYRALKR